MLAMADSHIHLFRMGYAGVYGRSPAGIGDEVDVYETFRHVHNIVAALVVGYEDAQSIRRTIRICAASPKRADGWSPLPSRRRPGARTDYLSGSLPPGTAEYRCT